MFGNFRGGTDSKDFQRARDEERSSGNDRLPGARSRIPVFELLEQRAMLTSLTAFPGTADGAAGSLRADIIATNADAGTATDTIQLLSGTYTLNVANSQANGHENAAATGDLNITNSAHTLIIQGQGSTGPNATIIDQTALDRVFEVAAGVTVVFENVEITGGTAVDDGTSGALPFSTDANGGGILNAGGNVTLTDVAVVGNQAGVASNTVQETISGEGQSANGGGIFSAAGLLTINGTVAGASLIKNNSAIGGAGDHPVSGAGTQGGNAGGGGIFSSKETGANIVLGQVLISNTTFQGNSAQGGAGGAGVNGSASDNGFGQNGGAGGSAAGGAIFLDGDSTTGDALSNDIFTTSTATGGAGGAGGAVDAADSNGFTPTGGSGGNGGSAAGGAVADSSGAGTFATDTFSTNLAQGGGGGTGGAGAQSFAAGGGGSGGTAGGGGYSGLGNENTNSVIGFTGSNITITDSALFGNQAFGGAGASGATGGVGGDGEGGGLLSNGLSLDTTLTNDTLTSNTAKGGAGGGNTGGNAFGGGIFDGSGDSTGDTASVSATNDTINANSAQAGTGTANGSSWGGGLFARVASVTPNAAVTAVIVAPQNLLIAGNSATNGPDVVGSITNTDHNLIGDGTDSNFANGANGDQVGTTQSPITVNLGPLKNNGGLTETEGLPTGNPAIGVGDPAAATAANLSTDQRGPGFSRFNAGTVDIGAYELQAVLPVVTGATTTESVQTTSGLVITTGNTGAQFFQITAITGGTLFQADGTTPITGGDFITATQGVAGLKFTPTTGSLTAGSFSIQGSTTNAVGGLVGSTAKARITVTLSQPNVTGATTTVNAQTTSGLVITPGTHDSSAAFFQITSITGGTLFQADGTTAIANGSFITVAQGAAGLKFTPSTGSTSAGGFTVRQSTTGAVGGLNGPLARAAIAVNRIQPTFVGATTTENVQTTSGLVITPGNSGAQFFQITAIAGGTLFQADGTTPIANGDFITAAQGAAGLKFTPTTGSLSGGNFLLQGSTTNAVGGLVGSIERVTIAVTLSLPKVTSATTPQNAQSTSGLVITPGTNDTSAAFFRVTFITGGTLFQADSVTPIANGSFITVAQGAAGLKFTPNPGSLVPGGFSVQQSTTADVTGLSGPTARASITVTRTQPTATGATTTENLQTTSGLVITPGNSGAQFYQITAITGGTLFQTDGTTQIASGDFITAAQGSAGLKFTPAGGSVTNGSFLLQGSTTSAVGGLTGSIQSVAIAVTLSQPNVTPATTPKNTQSTSGLVITPGANDTSPAFFQITSITGGTLFQNDGTTPITNGSFITLAQAAAGLKFTPNIGSMVAGGFTVRQSTTSAVGGLSGPSTRAAITVT